MKGKRTVDELLISGRILTSRYYSDGDNDIFYSHSLFVKVEGGIYMTHYKVFASNGYTPFDDGYLINEVQSFKDLNNAKAYIAKKGFEFNSLAVQKGIKAIF
ncbi:hypothetical protein RIV76_001682 [Salmonella enterica]|nr:hypothetical protein [Salmonella enterica]EJU7756465.1 hypothetical protein [Salmonella enterica subsp. enterica serovar 11:b:1,7]ELC1624257.1 hypothetical protein [Salmonella enterica]